MSLSTTSPLIIDWIQRGFSWTHLWRPIYRTFPIPARSSIDIPQDGYIFNAPEGVFLSFGALFDDPSCGVRFECQQIDTSDYYTGNRLTQIGYVNQPMYASVMSPPQTPPGLHFPSIVKEFAWTDWARLRVFNPDTVEHRCLLVEYLMAILLHSRPEPIVPLPVQIVPTAEVDVEPPTVLPDPTEESIIGPRRDP